MTNWKKKEFWIITCKYSKS